MNQYGCDSVVTLDLTVNPRFETTNTASFKVADASFANIGSRTLLVETLNLLSEFSCDSVVFNYETYEFVPNTYTDTVELEVIVEVYDTITVEVYDTTYLSVVDTLIIDIDTGIDGLPLPIPIQFKMYPNPAHSQLQISIMNWEVLAGYGVSVYNLEGQQVESIVVNSAELSVDVSNFAKGTYIVNVHKDGAILLSKKLVIKSKD